MLDLQEQMLNGGFARPVWPPAPDAARVGPAAPARSIGSSAPRSDPQAVWIAWLVLFGLVVLANVLTFEIQR